MTHGLDPANPAAVIERATTPLQRVVTGTVATLPATAKAAYVNPPTLNVIGEAVRVRAPLSGTRPDYCLITDTAVAAWLPAASSARAESVELDEPAFFPPLPLAPFPPPVFQL